MTDAENANDSEPAMPPAAKDAPGAAPGKPDGGRPVRTVSAPQKKTAQGESWLETVKTVVYALLIALVIRTVLFQPFNIPSSSMEDTLLIGDYLFVEKFAYGYSRYSLPYGHIFPSVGRIFFQAPTRGDVIVFKMPNRDSPDYGEDFIKRLIGLPGDRIQMLGGQLYLNGKAVPKVRAPDYVESDEFGMVNHVPRYRETMPNGKSYFVLDRIPNGAADNTRVFVVPPGHYFMMGDNRDNSDDSRLSVGFVPAEDLVGKAEFRFFSIDDTAVWYEPWTWPGAIRYRRMFTSIE
jgi:signal peptidase I